MSTFPKSIFFIISIIVFIISDIHSQAHPDSDSLLTAIKLAPDDTTKIELYHKIAWNNWFNDIELSRACTDTALIIAKSISHQKLIAKCSHYYGLYHRITGNADSAIVNFEKALELYGPNADSLDISVTIFNLGVMNYEAGNYQEAIESYLVYKRINVKENNHKGICQADNSIGLVFKRIKDYDKCIEYLQSSLQRAEENDLTLPQAIALGNLQSISIEIDSLELSTYYGKRALIQEEKLNNLAGSGLIYDNLGLAYLYLDQLDSATVYSKIAIESLESYGQQIHLCEAYATMGIIQEELDKPTLAIKYLKQALDIAIKGNYKPTQKRIYQGLSQANQKLKNYKKSNEYLNKYVTISDSLFNAEKFETISDIEVKYETAQKEIELKSQDLEIQKQTSRKNIFTISSVLLGLLAAAIFFFMRNRIKSSKKIAYQDALLKTQKINQLQKEKKILAMNAMIEGQEAERMRIAKDLHDGLGGLLSTVKARLTNINAEVKKIESYNIYEKTTSMVDEACDEVRRISHNLLPGALRLDGLKTAAQQLGEELDEAHPFNVKVEVIGYDDKLDETKEIFLYRIIQEATNNIVKYADAKEVLIQLSETDEEYHLIIEDDGIGFDQTIEHDGLGLKSIRSRVEHLGGEIDTHSKINIGTTISIQVPKAVLNNKL